MSQDFSVLLHTPTDGTDGDCTASLKNPRGIEPRRILPQPRGSQAHTCMSPQSSDCLTFIHNLKPSDPSIFFRTPHLIIKRDLLNTNYDAVFVLGGVQAENSLSINELKNSFGIDSTKELKAKNDLKGSFFDILKKVKVTNVLNLIEKNGWHIHFNAVQVLYYGFVDIVDSIEGLESDSYEFKAVLYDILRDTQLIAN